jgi:hypothetical protein
MRRSRPAGCCQSIYASYSRLQRVNQLSAISSRARGPRRIRPELWVEPPPISFCQILFDRIGWAGGAGSAAVAAAAELGGQASPTPRSQQSTDMVASRSPTSSSIRGRRANSEKRILQKEFFKKNSAKKYVAKKMR